MKIILDISQIVYTGTGVARFTTGLVDAILTHETSIQWSFFCSTLSLSLDTKIRERIRSSNHRLIEASLPPTLFGYLCNDLHSISSFVMPRLIPDLKSYDMYISSDWAEPKLPIAKATIVHDLVFKRYPETVDPTILKTQTKRLQWVSQESQRIFVDSQSTGDDLEKYYQIDPKRIVVNYPGVDTEATETDTSILKEFELDKPFLLSVGKQEPRKNLARLIAAFEKIPGDVNLVIVGPRGWGSLETSEDLRIKYIGYVSDAQLHALYTHARGFIFPSIYEGFGYPVAEAMQLGCPVAASNSSSIPELTGDEGALLFDPLRTEDIQHALESILKDESLRQRLIEEGKRRAALFTWKRYYNTLKENLVT